MTTWASRDICGPLFGIKQHVSRTSNSKLRRSGVLGSLHCHFNRHHIRTHQDPHTHIRFTLWDGELFVVGTKRVIMIFTTAQAHTHCDTASILSNTDSVKLCLLYYDRLPDSSTLCRYQHSNFLFSHATLFSD